MRRNKIWNVLLVLAIIASSNVTVDAQPSERDREMTRWLEDDGDFLDKDGRDLAIVRDVVDRALDLKPGSRIEVDASKFGGIRIKGWSQGRIQVTARIKTAAATREEAEALAEDVEVVIQKNGEGVEIYSDGPRIRNETFWSVKFDVRVPVRSDLNLETGFGGISIEEVNGNLRFYAEFGSLDLEKISGRAVGETRFGSINVELDGRNWIGERLDVSTQFGSIKAYIPGDYSADLETGTSFGSMSVDFPITVQGRLLGKQVRTQLGEGGAPVRLMTQFGGIDIRER